MIITGRINKIELEDRKKIQIEVRIGSVVGICFNGVNLVENEFQPYYNYNSHKNGINANHVQYCNELFSNLYNYNLIGYIRKHDIYDNTLPHLNDDLNENLKLDNYILCVIIRNKLHDDPSIIQKLRRNDFLELSLKNSIIKNASQYFLTEYHKQLKIPFILGINYGTETNKWTENSQKLFLKNPALMNESILQNLKKDLKIEEFDGLSHSMNYKQNDESGFSYEKIRKVQNYDWADEYFKKGIAMMNLSNYEKAIEYFKDAEKLDSLNKDIYLEKGICYLNLNNLEKAKKDFKSCLKIEPHDETAKKHLMYITKKEKESMNSGDYDHMLSKKRFNK